MYTGPSRLRRNLTSRVKGLFGGRWYFKLFNLLVGLAGLAMACLGRFSLSVILIDKH